MPGGMPAPLEIWATWPVPNYENPTLHPLNMTAFACVIGPISIAMLVIRLWVRLCVQKNAGLDDWLMLAAFVPVIALTVICPLTTDKYRFNRHTWDIELYIFPIQRKILLVIYALFTIASGLIKVSVLLFYRRLTSRTVSRGFRWAMWSVMAIIVAYTIAFLFAITFSCRPFNAFWRQTDWRWRFQPGYHYKCINEGADIVANGVIASVQDLVVVTFPTTLCWTVQIPRQQKLALYGIFALSYCTVVVGAVRTWTTWRIYYQTYDITWLASEIWLWSLLELHLGSMCANAPALKVLFAQKPRPKLPITRKGSAPSKSRSNVCQTQRSADTNTTLSTIISTRSLREKLSFWSSSTHSQSDSAYAQGPPSDVPTGQRHEVLMMDALVDPDVSEHDGDSMSDSFHTESNDTTFRYYPRDMEMGDLSPRTSSEVLNFQALPPLQSPERARMRDSIRSLPSSGRAKMRDSIRSLPSVWQ